MEGELGLFRASSHSGNTEVIQVWELILDLETAKGQGSF